MRLFGGHYVITLHLVGIPTHPNNVITYLKIQDESTFLKLHSDVTISLQTRRSSETFSIEYTTYGAFIFARDFSS